MNSDSVLVAEGLALCVDTHHSRHSRIERINTLVRCAACVSRLTDELNGLGNKAEATAVNEYLVAGGVALCVNHHRRVYIVELAESDKLLLAAEILNLAVFGKRITVTDLYELLCRNGEEGNVAIKLRSILGQSYSNAEHSRKLCVMSASVCRARLLISGGMSITKNGVKLTNNANIRLGATTLESPLHTCKCKTVAARNAEGRKLLFNVLCGCALLVSKLGICKYVLCNFNYFAAVSVYFFTDDTLE